MNRRIAMSDALIPALAVLAGFLLGAVFFGGLSWTVRKGVSSQNPALWFFCSLVLRMSIALTGFYFVGRGHWERLLLCLLGFVLARLLVVHLTRPSGGNKARPPGENQVRPIPEANHAP
jgi:F1F0 ATPase subunit 2